MTMKKLIRKILRESHDMDWVEDTNLSPYHGVKFTVSRRDYGHPLCSYFILYDAAISDSHTGVNKELVNKPRATYGESYYVYCDYEGNEEPTANGLKGLSMYSKEGIDDKFDKGNWIRVDNVIDGDLNEVKKILKEDDFDFIEDDYSLDGIKFTHRDHPQLIYTIIDGGGYNIEVTWGSSTHNGTWYQRNRAEALFHNGEWIIYDTINEDHDMDWIEDVNSNPLDGLKFKWWGDRSANPTIYIIINVNLNYVAIYLEKYWTGDRMGSTTGYSGEVHKNIALNNINSGEWVIVDDTGSRLPPIF
jgi:hypothetical protein